MKAFAELIDRLVYTPARNDKLRLLAAYFRATPDPDRGWALAALTDGLPFSFPVRRTLGDLMERRLDAELYRLSREYVGDTAETVALMWPEPACQADPPRIADVVASLELISRDSLGPALEGWLDRLDASGRFALLKLLTGGLRVGVSARLAKTALAEVGGIDVGEIEEVWHGLKPPYADLFAWLDGRTPRPDARTRVAFKPLMLAHPLEEADWSALTLQDYAVEWKWDGIRVQVVAGGGVTRLYSRTGDEITRSFPDIASAWSFDAVLDGELLVLRDGVVAPFNDLQQRLNRKAVTRRMLGEFPAHVRLYDALRIGGEDVRSLPYVERRERLLAWHAVTLPPRSDVSPLVEAASKEELRAMWSATRAGGIEGMMLKRRASPYLAGRPKGQWWKWKRAPLTLDFVLMYAQRGSGKRSSFYSDFTFGAWRGEPDAGGELVPVGKCYSGFTNEELGKLDRFVRANTINRFGPVRVVEPRLVLEVAFDAAQRSTRHKSGFALRFPRIARIRWDKPAADADRLDAVAKLIDG